MEQSLAPGSQTFEQDLFRLYKETVITLDEALANSDSPTNLSWLINNSEFTTDKKEDKRPDSPLDFGMDSQTGASFKEFTLSLSDSDEEETKDAS
ncbi:MAG: twitching motility protein PilU [Pseudomonadota bacterium]|nr:twitching motility protein PilU [Pseudomonadota bacterium]